MPIRLLLVLRIWLSVLQGENAVHGEYRANHDLQCAVVRSSELEFYIKIDVYLI